MSLDPAPDYDGLFKSLLEAYPEDTLRVLFGVDLNGRHPIPEGPDKVFVLHRSPEERERAESEGLPAPLHDVFHLEIQLKRTRDFPTRMANYFCSLAFKYDESQYRIHQLALWPKGRGCPGHFREPLGRSAADHLRPAGGSGC